ncbi:WSD1 family O-acyltransferase [Amycolatopsis acidicola]|uniref:WSD1 family O-acyltransferase n=1 Tax=Amycolatopsis acidicola TaxID=2596893 RepID=A0A5N0UPI8_9PSEU|nr:WS/DGAT domain-containing protein [Amycolatopsis acidicola]KAA9152166.1 WSD1 family O-acyltransferase [Amycolatopsis acidicola]
MPPLDRRALTCVLWTRTAVDPAALRAEFPAELAGFEVTDLPGAGAEEALRGVVARQAEPARLVRGYGEGSALVLRCGDPREVYDVLRPVGPGIPVQNDPVFSKPAGTAARETVGELGGRLRRTVRGLRPAGRMLAAGPACGVAAALGAAGGVLDLAVSTLPAAPLRLADALVTSDWETLTGMAKLLSRRRPDAGPVPQAVAWSRPVPTKTIAAISRAAGAPLADVHTALVTGALARCHGTGALSWLLPGAEGTVVLPGISLGHRAFRDRLAEVRRRAVRVPRGLASHLTGADVGVLTDVRGPAAPMLLGGVPVEGITAWAEGNNQGVTVSAYRYAGRVVFGCSGGRGSFPEPGRFAQALAAEVDEAAATVRRTVIPLFERRTRTA